MRHLFRIHFTIVRATKQCPTEYSESKVTIVGVRNNDGKRAMRLLERRCAGSDVKRIEIGAMKYLGQLEHCE